MKPIKISRREEDKIKKKNRKLKKGKLNRPNNYCSNDIQNPELFLKLSEARTVQVENPNDPINKFTMEDFQNILLFVAPNKNQKKLYKSENLDIIRLQDLGHTTVIVIEGITLSEFKENISHFPKYTVLFDYSFGLTLQQSFPSALIKNYLKNPCQKMDLLLNPYQMLLEDYPGPCSNDYVYTSDKYSKVSNSAPLFSLDCEMCQAKSGKVLTRITLVNEEHECLYDTLVKPSETIIDYITHYSGITAKKLENVTTTLQDVQSELKRILPSDAILVGQSLGNDLHALKMIHPFVIDSSNIYSKKGEKRKLRDLAYIFLGEKIQQGNKGHDSIEDSKVALKLIQLKLKKGLRFGTFHEKKGSSDLFSRLNQSKKKVTIVAPRSALNEYVHPNVTGHEKIHTFANSNIEDLVSAAQMKAKDCDFLICHLAMNSEHESEKNWITINASINRLYDSSPANSLVYVVFTGHLNLEVTNGDSDAFFSIGIKPLL